MDARELPSKIGISDRRANLISLFLGGAGFFTTPFLQRWGFLPDARYKFSDYADFYAIVGAAIGLITPYLFRFGWYAINRLRPRPGAKAYGERERHHLANAFEIDRRMLSIAMVPSHPATAQAARSSREIDLADALLVTPNSSQALLREFIGMPRLGPRQTREPQAHLEKNILVITGEPGAGKSVLIQELHATLSKGVEDGFHSMLPFVILARDLTLDILQQAIATDDPMAFLLMKYYKQRASSSPIDSNLAALYNLVADKWQELDALIIIDGLDEIAQRSFYEDIQRILSTIIRKDLLSNEASIHRYVLSCRIDEDLELFPDAFSIVLRGLSDEDREHFCKSLIAKSHLDSGTTKLFEDVLRANRVAPSHVFRRNPYFLSLLLRHLQEDEDRVRDQVLDFDLLMRKYLRREAERPFTSFKTRQSVSVEDRHALFDQLEKVSRPSLQYLAFRTASTSNIGALYDETAINMELLKNFSCVIAGSVSDRKGPWDNLNRLLHVLVSPQRRTTLTSEQLSKLNADLHLHENDIRLLDSISLQLKQTSTTFEELLTAALGTIPYKGLSESDEWYSKLTRAFNRLIVGEITLHMQLCYLLFLRSIAAAHALRIISINLSNDQIFVRFRHRRLAEYYAASYIRDNWNVVHGSLHFSPWLAPVLNLTCAQEGPACLTLTWLAAKITDIPERPFYQWRHMVEAAVEAAFFSHPGKPYFIAVEKISKIIVNALRSFGSRQIIKQATNSLRIDAVTEIALLRALDSIGSLKSTFGGSIFQDHIRFDFAAYIVNLPSEWITSMLPARDAVESLTEQHFSAEATLAIIWQLIQQPGVILSSGVEISRRRYWRFYLPTLVFTALREVSALVLLTVLCASGIALLAHRIALETVEVEHLQIAASCVTGVSLLIVRLLAWLKSPTQAASWGVRFFSVILRLPYLGWTKMRDLVGEVHKFKSLPLLKQRKHLLLSMCIISGVTAGVLLLGLFLPADRLPSKPEPCPEIDNEETRILQKYTAAGLLKNVTLEEVKHRLDFELKAFTEMNKKRSCGFKDPEDGHWTLAEEELIDMLAEQNPALIASAQSPLVLDSKERQQILRFRSAPAISLSAGWLHSLSVLYTRWQLHFSIRHLQVLRRKLIEQRRIGRGVTTSEVDSLARGDVITAVSESSNIQIGSISASNILLNLLNHELELRHAALKNLDVHIGHAYSNALILFLTMIMMSIISMSLHSRLKDYKWKKRISIEDSIFLLCAHLKDSELSEQVRLVSLRRIDFLGVTDQRELDELEASVGALFAGTSAIDRTIAVKAAKLARTLGNRLRHRTITDLPISLSAQAHR